MLSDPTTPDPTTPTAPFFCPPTPDPGTHPAIPFPTVVAAPVTAETAPDVTQRAPFAKLLAAAAPWTGPRGGAAADPAATPAPLSSSHVYLLATCLQYLQSAEQHLDVLVARLREAYPKVNISLHQATPHEVARMIIDEVAEIGMATESLADYPELVTLPCYEWQHVLVVPAQHPLATVERPSLEQLAQGCGHFIHRQADDVGERAGHAVENHVGAFLNAVGSCLVEGVHLGVIGADQVIREGLEGDMGDDMQLTDHSAIAGKRHSGTDFMGAIRETANHAERLLHVCGLGEWIAIDVNQSVGTDDECCGPGAADGQRFAPGVFQGELFGCQRGIVGLFHL